MSQQRLRTRVEENLLMLPNDYSIHVLLKKGFRGNDLESLVGAVKDVLYAMKMQNLGHYPLEFEAYNAHVSVSRIHSSYGKRIVVSKEQV